MESQRMAPGALPGFGVSFVASNGETPAVIGHPGFMPTTNQPPAAGTNIHQLSPFSFVDATLPLGSRTAGLPLTPTAQHSATNALFNRSNIHQSPAMPPAVGIQSVGVYGTSTGSVNSAVQPDLTIQMIELQQQQASAVLAAAQQQHVRKLLSQQQSLKTSPVTSQNPHHYILQKQQHPFILSSLNGNSSNSAFCNNWIQTTPLRNSGLQVQSSGLFTPNANVNMLSTGNIIPSSPHGRTQGSSGLITENPPHQHCSTSSSPSVSGNTSLLQPNNNILGNHQTPVLSTVPQELRQYVQNQHNLQQQQLVRQDDLQSQLQHQHYQQQHQQHQQQTQHHLSHPQQTQHQSFLGWPTNANNPLASASASDMAATLLHPHMGNPFALQTPGCTAESRIFAAAAAAGLGYGIPHQPNRHMTPSVTPPSADASSQIFKGRFSTPASTLLPASVPSSFQMTKLRPPSLNVRSVLGGPTANGPRQFTSTRLTHDYVTISDSSNTAAANTAVWGLNLSPPFSPRSMYQQLQAARDFLNVRPHTGKLKDPSIKEANTSFTLFNTLLLTALSTEILTHITSKLNAAITKRNRQPNSDFSDANLEQAQSHINSFPRTYSSTYAITGTLDRNNTMHHSDGFASSSTSLLSNSKVSRAFPPPTPTGSSKSPVTASSVEDSPIVTTEEGKDTMEAQQLTDQQINNHLYSNGTTVQPFIFVTEALHMAIPPGFLGPSFKRTNDSINAEPLTELLKNTTVSSAVSLVAKNASITAATQCTTVSLLAAVLQFFDGHGLCKCEMLNSRTRTIIHSQIPLLWKHAFIVEEDDNPEEVMSDPPPPLSLIERNSSVFFKLHWLIRQGGMQYTGFRERLQELKEKLDLEADIAANSEMITLSDETCKAAFRIKQQLLSQMRKSSQISSEMKSHARAMNKIVRTIRALQTHYAEGSVEYEYITTMLRIPWALAALKYQEENRSSSGNKKK